MNQLYNLILINNNYLIGINFKKKFFKTKNYFFFFIKKIKLKF
jgi:hypothetical protein